MTSVVETMHIAAEKGEPVGCIYKMHNDYLSKKANHNSCTSTF